MKCGNCGSGDILERERGYYRQKQIYCQTCMTYFISSPTEDYGKLIKVTNMDQLEDF